MGFRVRIIIEHIKPVRCVRLEEKIRLSFVQEPTLPTGIVSIRGWGSTREQEEKKRAKTNKNAYTVFFKYILYKRAGNSKISTKTETHPQLII